MKKPPLNTDFTLHELWQFTKPDFMNKNDSRYASPPPNGWRYPLVGGTRQRHLAGINSKPRKHSKNARTPTSRVHAVLGGVLLCKTRWLKKDDIAKPTKFIGLLEYRGLILFHTQSLELHEACGERLPSFH